MNHRIDEVVRQLDEVTQGVQTEFGGLSDDQLNWKPATDSWSIAQCLEHLVTINSLYFPVFASLRTGELRPTRWERHSPLSGLFGRFLVRTLSPEYPRKMRTSPKAEPSASRIPPGILDRFARHQGELAGHVLKLPSTLDPRTTIITSPLLAWVTYSLDDCLTILAVHERRHFQQSQRVARIVR